MKSSLRSPDTVFYRLYPDKVHELYDIYKICFQLLDKKDKIVCISPGFSGMLHATKIGCCERKSLEAKKRFLEQIHEEAQLTIPEITEITSHIGSF